MSTSPRLACLAFICTLLGTSAARADDAPALVYPNGLALDAAGNLYVSDIGSHRIFKLAADGKLSVVAGTGEPGFSGDAGPATAARLNAPTDLLFDADGNLVIADAYNHRVRRIDAQGVITTLVGTGKSNPSTAPTTASAVALNNPQGLALDRHGSLYIADTYNHVVRRIDHAGNVTTFAGSEAGLAGDKGPATKAQLNLPQAVAVALDGSVYISDSANSRIRRVAPDGNIITVCGSGPGSGEGGAGFAGDGGSPEKAKLFSPADLKFNALGQLVVCDTGNNRIRLIAYNVVHTLAGPAQPVSAPAGLNTPQKLALAPDGSIYVADRANARVLKLTPAGTITTVASGPRPPGVLIDPAVLPRQ
jgi:sugar lactone lactonase YvrE